MKTIHSAALHNFFKIIFIAVFALVFAVSASATTYTVSSNVNATTLAGNSADTLYIDAKVTINTNVVTWGFTTVIIRAPNGEINWTSNPADLELPNCTAFTIQSGAVGVQPANGGSASKLLTIGGVKIAVANTQSSNAAYSFADFNAAGGLPQFLYGLSQSGICAGSTITDTLTPLNTNSLYDCYWTISPAAGGTFSPSTNPTFTNFNTVKIATFTASGSASGTYTITCSVYHTGDGDVLASKSFAVTISPTTVAGTLSSVSACSAGGTGTLTLSGNTGSAVQWQSSPDGSTWTTATSNYTVSNQTTYYRALVQSGACPSAYSGTSTVGVHNYWVGTNSTDWSTNGNWSDKQLPSFGTCPTATIPAGTTYSPQLSTATAVTNLTIASGANLDLNNQTLTISGTFSGSSTGYLNGSTASGLTIIGTAGTLYFDQTTNGSTNALKNLNISSGSATLGNALNIAAGTYASPGTLTATGTLNTGGFLTLKSDANGDARVGNSSGTISGDVTVERYIPALRAWRFLTAPFGSSSQTINAAWQEGQQNTSQPATCPTNDPAPNNYGMYITNTNGSTANGYDWNAYGTQPSFKVWQNGLWVAPSGTNIPITNYPAYCAFVRGDRHVCIQYGSTATATTTTLRSTGELNQATGAGVTTKDFATSSTPGQYVFVGNPFASSINLTNILTRSSGIVSTQFSLWDPKRTGGTTNNVGGYVQYTSAGGGTIVPNGSPSYLTAASALIVQSGQAFFVKESSASSSAIVKFLEGDKTTSESNVFGKVLPPASSPVVYANLMIPSGDSLVLSDGVGAVFGDGFSADVDQDDVQKLFNFNENIELIRNDNKLAIELRPLPKLTDTLFLKLYLAQHPYTLQLFTQSFANMPFIKAWLVDNYLNTKTEVNLQDTTLYNFTTNLDTNSYRNRFMLVLKRQYTANPAPVTQAVNQGNPGISGIANSIVIKASGVNIYPNPVSDGKAMLRFNNMEPGIYEVTVYNTKGQKLMSNTFQHAGGGNVYQLSVNESWPTGVYSVSVLNEDSRKMINVKLVVSK